MKKNQIRFVLLAALASVQAFAQVGVPTAGAAMGGSTNPLAAFGYIITLLGGLATLYFIAALIWTCIKGAASDHDQFHKLPNLFFWGALCAGATFIVNRIAIGA